MEGWAIFILNHLFLKQKSDKLELKMGKPILIDAEFDFDRQIWWAYFDSEKGNVGNYKRFGVNKLHYKFRAKLDFKKNEECEAYLLKRAQKYMKQFNDFSEMPEEKIIGPRDE